MFHVMIFRVVTIDYCKNILVAFIYIWQHFLNVCYEKKLITFYEVLDKKILLKIIYVTVFIQTTSVISYCILHMYYINLF